MSQTAIHVSNLTKFYGEVEAVKELSLDVDKGVAFGFLGPNGAGKTTTIRMLLGIINPTRGSGKVLGYDIGKQRKQIYQHVGYLPEEVKLREGLRGRRFLEYMARLKGFTREESKNEAQELLAWVELEEWGRKKIKTYSEGMKKRLFLAHALLGNPDLLILDEPTKGLDPEWRIKIRQKIQELVEEGNTIFLSSHILSEVERICNEVAFLFEGQLRAQGATDELTDKLEKRTFTIRASDPLALKSELSEMEFIKDLTINQGRVQVTVNNPDVMYQKVPQIASKQGIRIYEIMPGERLERLFKTFMEEENHA